MVVLPQEAQGLMVVAQARGLRGITEELVMYAEEVGGVLTTFSVETELSEGVVAVATTLETQGQEAMAVQG